MVTAMEITRPKHLLRAHEGPFEGKSIEEIVQEPAGRRWLAELIPTRPPKHQEIGLAWLSWSLQREVTRDDLDEIASG
jgi:hypothetical protein